MTGLHLLAAPFSAAFIALLVAIALTRAALGYALRRGMLDAPGKRRSHTMPTPRGGGAGLVLGALAGMGVALVLQYPPMLILAFMLSTLLVTVSGWWDDHQALPAWPRLLAHLSAAGLFIAVLLSVSSWSWWWFVPLLLAGAWSINLHNFMDGIDGLLGMQLVFVGAAMYVFGWLTHAPGGLLSADLALAAAAAGFLVYNRPPARIFMGDVGSGSTGLLLFMLGGLWCLDDSRAAWLLLILNATFICDSGWTLAWRMLCGRRWYTAHREHLYQWLVRCGLTHGQTGCLYLAFNVLVCAPVAWVARSHAAQAVWLCLALYAFLSLVWWGIKWTCVRQRRSGGLHARA